MITFENLLEFGFRESRPNDIDRFDRAFYHTVRENGKKKFTVGVRYWDYSKYPSAPTSGSFDAQVQFNNGCTFNVELFIQEDMLPADIVMWFELMFNKLNCIYYDDL